MTLHPQVRALLDAMAASGFKPVHGLDPDAARRQFEAMIAAREAPPIQVGEVTQRDIPGPGGALAVRLYRPAGAGSMLPALVYFHGGGHVFGNLDTHDAVARALCAKARCLVMSVDYRLAPEARFPAAVDDAYAATTWLFEHADELGVDPARVAVGGDSAGANLAAVVSLIARDGDGPRIGFQLLVYPITDYACDSASYARFPTGFGLLEARTMHWFRDHYLGAGNGHEDWRASPLKARDHAGLPPALVITAGHDVLHDEGAAYAARLARAGCQVRHSDYPGVIHGFFAMAPMLDDAVSAQEEAGRALREAFG